MTTFTDTPSLSAVLREDVAKRVVELQAGVLGHRGSASESQATGALAILRRCDPADPVTHPSAWAFVQQGTPPAISAIPKGADPDQPTPAERARHCAIVLFANHQQAQGAPMHRAGFAFPQSVARLGRIRSGDASELEPGVRARFQRVVLAPTWGGRAEHLLALIRMMRAEAIAIDYGRLASDLLALSSPTYARGVRVRWGRDLYRATPTTDASPATTNEGVE